ncbi:MAG: cytidine deaminase [Alphaproteobacteria bacterium]|nr:cytidine deaminase [Alphaproteobacteria bacterium]MDE2110656.1 cytidine deaminase [Alphaproteobacteria bacterium]MDE2495085.1 cytidine deaminase [Alphaproteobacteria bacterium]
MVTGPVPEMVELAKQMVARSYSPYSRYATGAVLRGANGKLYGGCNVENAAYPQGTCAEASAISVMVADGEKRIAEILVIGSGPEIITPCGGCRQRLREFAADNTLVHLCDPSGVRRTVTFGELYPMSFGSAHLGAKT